MIVCIQSPPRLLLKFDQKWLTRQWLSCSGWDMERLSLVLSYKGGRFIRTGQSRAKVNIWRIPVGYLNPTINRKTRNTESEIGTAGSSHTRQNLRVDRSSHTWQNPRVDGSGPGLGLPRLCGSGFWTVLEPNWTIFLVQAWTAGGLPRPVANTIQGWKLTASTVHVIYVYLVSKISLGVIFVIVVLQIWWVRLSSTIWFYCYWYFMLLSSV